MLGHSLIEALGDGPIVAPSRDVLDLLDDEAVVAAVEEAAPAAVFHLAAQASVGRSWEAPAEVISENILMTLNVLEAVRREAPGATVVVASSGEIYGPPEQLPVDEDAALRPQNPYAVSKVACDLLARQYSDAHDLHVVRLRAFNQAGPGQSSDYVVGTIAEQIAAAERRGDPRRWLRRGILTRRGTSSTCATQPGPT